MDNGIQSKERVKEFGEVFTPDKIVNDMMDLVDKQFGELSAEDYILKTILEPACGDGQFLIRILYRKLLKVAELPVDQRPLALVKALSSIYGVDIQADNVKNARDRMFKVTTGKEITSFDLDNVPKPIIVELDIEYTEQLLNVINFILENNIIVANTLEPDKVIFKSYHFNGSKVSTASAILNSLDFEFDTTNEVDYLDLPSLGSSSDSEESDFDF